MLEIIFHGRGGQGAVTSSELLASAASKEGYEAQAFSFYGAERRGAPVFAFLRIDKKRILRHGMFFRADSLVVLDKGLFNFQDFKRVRIKKGGKLIVNAEQGSGGFFASKVEREGEISVYSINATKIALEEGLVIAGWPLVNTPILGALVKINAMPSLNSLIEAVREKFEGQLGEKNARAVKRAFEEVHFEGDFPWK
ncbi:MAG: 2-oxoacid:acceptor oxidoreductase family protein [Fervidicoccaceae archaeon]